VTAEVTGDRLRSLGERHGEAADDDALRQAAVCDSAAQAPSTKTRRAAAPRRGGAEPGVALLLELERQLLAAGADDAAVDQHVHEVGHDVVEQALVVGDDEKARSGCAAR
jgi:hypothetical protein